MDAFLKYGNNLPKDVLEKLEILFSDTIKLVFETFGERAFSIWRVRKGKWNWFDRPVKTAYDPIMFVFSHHLNDAENILKCGEEFRSSIKNFYEKNYEIFGGSSTTNISTISKRNEKFEEFVTSVIGPKR